ncbi:MAG: hypothetical protein HQ518_23080, partial [Rhodopirellula sp.]|nr:hypothetical protein [Rhodopirellula sp.]
PTSRSISVSDTGTGTITDNDTATFMINDVTVDEADGTATFTVSLDKALNIPVSVLVKFANGTTTDTDFASTPVYSTQTVTFPAGDTTSRMASITLTDDTIVEQTETFTTSLAISTATPVGARSVVTADTGTGTINDNDTATFTINDVTVNENAGTATFTVSLSNPIDTAATVNVSYAGGTATGSGTDYDSTTDQVTFAANSTTVKQVTVAITNDNQVELTETFIASLALDAATPLTGRTKVLTDTGTGTITDNDTATFTINDVTVDEAAGNATFTVSLDKPLDINVDVDVSFADVTTDAGDFTHTTQTVSFAAGTTTAQTVMVPITNDTMGESTETFTASLAINTTTTNPAPRSVVTTDTGTGTITDNDVTITINDVTVNEAAGTATFTVAIDKTLDIPITVDVNYSGGNAAGGGTDYDSATDSVTFAAGTTTSKTVTVAISNDNIVELNETFTASLSTATVLGGRTVDLTDTGTGTITDNDTATFTINDVSVNEANGTLDFTLSLNNPIDIAVNVDVSFADVTTDAGDFTHTTQTINFGIGDTANKTVSVPINNDTDVEATETFTASLAVTTVVGTRSVVATDTGTGTITDNDVNSATPLIIDDGDSGFSTVNGSANSWFNYGPGQGGFQGDQRYSFYNGADIATWTVAATGTFRIAATWSQHPFASPQAEYRILDGATLVATVFADQKRDPSAAADTFSASGVNWDELIASHTFTTNVTVQLVGDAGKLVIADAIRISAAGTLDAEASAIPVPTEPNLVMENLPAIFDVAINTWAASGQITDDQILQLQQIVPVITDLPGTQVGQLTGSVMLLDINGAGNGWFVDPTPEDSSEFNTLTALTERVASGNSHAVDDIDLLTVVMHEFGHALGQGDLDPVANPHDLMADSLATGVRRLPASVNAVTLTGSADLTVQLPETAGHVDVSLFDGYLVIQSNHTVLERISVDATRTLTINGTEGADNFRIDLDQSGDLNFDTIVVHGYGDDDDIVLDGVPQSFAGSLTISGDSGNDQIEIRGNQATSLTLNGDAGNDTLLGGLGAETINGGDGDDMLFGGAGDDRINGGVGRDMIWGNAGNDTLVGNEDDDTLSGGAGNDVLAGGAGNDRLEGQQGNDTLLGNDGNDILNGGAGKDALSGGDGNDQLRGGSQNDLLSGGLDDDVLQGNSGHDILAGDDGDDSLAGGQGSDSLDGGAGANYFFGQQAVDSLFGASALRAELLQNPQTVAPAQAAGSDLVVTIADDDSPTSQDSNSSSQNSESSTATGDNDFNIDTGFNLFAEWIDLV